MSVKTEHMLNCSIANVTMPEAISIVESYIADGSFHLGCGINADQIVKMNESEELKDIIHGADFVFADGMSIFFASKFLNTPLTERIGAIDLYESLLQVASLKRYKIYLLGTTNDILEKAVDYYHRQYPELIISGYHNGFWSDDEEEKLVDEINRSSPTLLFLGISSPKKERFIQKFRHKLHSVCFALGVGGTFDIHAGVYTRAPKGIQKIGMEWFWRLLQEPQRMFLRYTINNIKFIGLLIKEMLKNKSRQVAPSK